MSQGGFKSRGFIAVIAAALGSSVLGFAILVITSQFSPAGSNKWLTNPGYVAATAAIVLIWAPAFALIPAALLGYFVERPKARAMIKRGQGGLVLQVALSVLAAAALSLLLRIGLHLTNPMYQLWDPISLAGFSLIGLCSGVAWWFLVIVPQRRT